jgi:hypothetical protein
MQTSIMYNDPLAPGGILPEFFLVSRTFFAQRQKKWATEVAHVSGTARAIYDPSRFRSVEPLRANYI